MWWLLLAICKFGAVIEKLVHFKVDEVVSDELPIHTVDQVNAVGVSVEAVLQVVSAVQVSRQV